MAQTAPLNACTFWYFDHWLKLFHKLDARTSFSKFYQWTYPGFFQTSFSNVCTSKLFSDDDHMSRYAYRFFLCTRKIEILRHQTCSPASVKIVVSFVQCRHSLAIQLVQHLHIKINDTMLKRVQSKLEWVMWSTFTKIKGLPYKEKQFITYSLFEFVTYKQLHTPLNSTYPIFSFMCYFNV